MTCGRGGVAPVAECRRVWLEGVAFASTTASAHSGISLVTTSDAVVTPFFYIQWPGLYSDRAGLDRAGPGWVGLGRAGSGWVGLGRAGPGLVAALQPLSVLRSPLSALHSTLYTRRRRRRRRLSNPSTLREISTRLAVFFHCLRSAPAATLGKYRRPLLAELR